MNRKLAQTRSPSKEQCLIMKCLWTADSQKKSYLGQPTQQHSWVRINLMNISKQVARWWICKLSIGWMAVSPTFPSASVPLIKYNIFEWTCVHAGSLSRAWLFVTPWTVALQAPLSMGFSRQGYWRGLPCPPPGDLSDPEIKRGFLALQADSLPSKPSGKYCRLFSTILGLCLLDNSSTFPLIVAIQKNVSRYCQMSLGGNTHTCWRTATRSWLSGKCPTCSVNLRLPNDIAWRRDCA